MYITKTFKGNNLYNNNLDLSTRPPKSRSGLSLTGFTLIEMLVVLAIMGMIFAISVPAFHSMMETSKVSRGAELIYKTLVFARQHAITHSTDCMVVFATTTPGGSSIKMEYRAYKVYISGKGTIDDWEFLFKGAEIDSSSSIFDNTVSIPFPDDGDGNSSVAYVKFTSAGVPTTMKTIKVESSNDSTLFRKVTYSDISGRITLKGLGES